MQSRVAVLTGRPGFWVLLVGALFGASLVRALLQPRPPPPPPVLAQMPAFALPNDGGATLSSRDLAGRPFIANLLPADLAGAALAAETMRKLQDRTRNLGDALLLISFSRGRDPAALRELRGSQARSRRWILLAGAPDDVPAAVLLLVDGHERIRGRYDAADPDAIDRLLRDAMLLVASP